MSARLPDTTIDQMISLYQAGRTYDQITAELGIGRNAIKRWIKRRGIAQRLHPVPDDPAWLARLEQAWADPQQTTMAIAEAFMISTATLHLLVKKQGWPPRGKGFRTLENNLTSAQIDRITALYREPMTLKQIAAAAGVSVSTVRNLGIRLKLERVKQNGTGLPPEERRDEFQQAWRDGTPVTGIAASFGVNVSTAKHWRINLGLPDRPNLNRHEFSETQLSALQEAYEAGQSLNSLCKRFKTHKARIHREMEARGVKRRVVRSPARHQLADETIAAILQAYFVAGDTVEFICQTFAINTARLYQLLDRVADGARRKGKASGLAIELGANWQKKVRELYEQAVPVEEIARQLPGGGEWTVYRLLALQGLAPREQARRGRLQDAQLHAELRRLYADPSIPVVEIERILGLAKSTRTKLMRQLGIPPR